MFCLGLALVCALFFTASVVDAQPMGRGKPADRGQITGQGQSRGQSSGMPSATPMGRGGGGVSPVMMTCRSDLVSICDGKMGMPGVQCLMDNISGIS